jgi:cyclic dehypoxanthinyl futalosine synthase
MAGHIGIATAANVLDRAVMGRRLSSVDILALYRLPANEVRAAAHALRLQCTDPEIATYSIGGNIDYTNVCVVACKFCAFYRGRHQDGAFTLGIDEIARQMDEIARIGGLDVLIQGGVNPDLPMSWYLDLLRRLKRDYPQIHVDAFSPEEILGFENLTGRDAYSILAELKEAGLDGVPGAAAEILVDGVRERTAPTRIRTGDWFRIMDAVQRLHLHVPWVSMVTGFGEDLADRARHLTALRDQQDRALDRYGSGFAAFKVWPARLEHTRLNGAASPDRAEAIADAYLREVGIGRLTLSNVVNHRAVWRTMGFPVASVALRSGANDLCGTGSINAIDAAMAAAGKCLPDPNHALLSQVRDCIESAGFTAALRDPSYRVVFKHQAGASGK